MRFIIYILLFIPFVGFTQTKVDTIDIQLTALTINNKIELYGIRTIPNDIQFKLIVTQLSDISVSQRISPVLTFTVIDTLPFTRGQLSELNDTLYVKWDDVIKIIKP